MVAAISCWKKENVTQAHVHKVALHFAVAAVYVDHVGQRLKREKGDADGKMMSGNRQVGGKGPVEVFQDEHQVT
jgi:hypothetical protein